MYLKEEENKDLSEYFRLVNYLSLGQLYLLDNPLLRRELVLSDIKPKIVGHWGTAPGQNFIYMHLNRIIKKYDLNMLYVSGPGHGGQAMIANNYVDGTYTQFYPEITEDEEGLKKLFKQFSFPGGVSSHVAPETPGSINEGGELGYSLSHAAGSVLDNPSLISVCVIGDGEAETGPLATSWHINKFLNHKTDGTVLPILHLNGYKIANPTVFSRMTDKELGKLFEGYGWRVFIVEANEIEKANNIMAETLDKCVEIIKDMKKGNNLNDRYPMIVLKTPKGWTGPKSVEGSFRAHQVPVTFETNKEQALEDLKAWLYSYDVSEFFDKKGKIISKFKDMTPTPSKCMGANKVANGGQLMKELKTPNIEDYAFDIIDHGHLENQDTRQLGMYIRDLFELNKSNKNFRFFGPDEALSNRFNYAFDVTNRMWNRPIKAKDEFLSPDGRIMDSYLSEHVCEGMLEGYILTGRHGFLHTYEAFVRILDSMASQHAKWLKVTKEIPWRKSIPSLNYLLVSHVFQQDHNGYTHQDPGFLNHLVTKKADIIRAYLPPDTNCLLSTFDHCIKSKDYINVIVASKHDRPQWLSMEEAKEHCRKGVSIWDFASNDDGNPDVIMACCGETPTLETIAAVDILRKSIKNIKIRVVNVVDLMRLEDKSQHPHGLTQEEYDEIFTKDKPIIFNFHGYPSLIHQLTYKRHNQNLHVHGYIEEGTITTTFDIRVQNKIDRFNLIKAALAEIPKYREKGKPLVKWCDTMLGKHKSYIKEYGIDMPSVKNWRWED